MGIASDRRNGSIGRRRMIGSPSRMMRFVWGTIARNGCRTTSTVCDTRSDDTMSYLLPKSLL